MNRGPKPHRRVGGGALLATLVSLCALATPAAAATLSWTGAGSNANWSNTGNWSPAAPPTNGSSLTFGPLTGACAVPIMGAGCYLATNDVSGLSVNSLAIDDSEPYNLGGDPISLGAGGLTATWSNAGFEGSIGLPITLSAPQTWSVSGTLSLGKPLSGSGSALTINFNPVSTGGAAVYDYGGDSEVGPIHVNGNGQLGLDHSSGLNATDGQPIQLTDRATLFFYTPAQVGPVSSADGSVELYTSQVIVNGAVSLDANSTLGALIRAPGSGNFATLSATGPVTVAGRLDLEQFAPMGSSCAALPVGTPFTILSAMGPLTGAFANAPAGAMLGTWEGCPRGQGVTTLAEIGYTAHTVTATIIAAPTVPELRAALSKVLKPSGSAARIGTILTNGGYTFTFPAAIAGRVELAWFVKGKPYALAHGGLTVSGAGTAAVPVKLTKGGKAVFKHADKLKLTEQAVFLPAANPTITVSEHKSFKLKR